jgi:hypothetical protein
MKFSFTHEQATAYVAQHMSHPSFVPFHDPKQFANPKPFTMEDIKVETLIDVAHYDNPTPFSMEQNF